MATPSPESRRSRQDLTDAARELHPPAIDVRLGVRAAIAASPAALEVSTWAEVLADLARLPWMRAGLACGLAAAFTLCVSNWHAFSNELYDPMFAGGVEAGELFLFEMQ